MSNPPTALAQTSRLSANLALIVGSICLLGFIIDILVIGLPPDLFAPQWRLNFLQQVAERSLFLFIGSVLLFYSQLDQRSRLNRKFAIGCFILGVFLGLSSFLVIKDNFTLQDQAIANIKTQATELRNRVVQSQTDKNLQQKINSEALATALQEIDRQTITLQQDIQTGAMKTLISSAGTLLTVGIGFIGMARLSLMNRFQHRYKYRI